MTYSRWKHFVCTLTSHTWLPYKEPWMHRCDFCGLVRSRL